MTSSDGGTLLTLTRERTAKERLLDALLERSPDLACHVEEVGELAASVGARLGLTASALEELRLGAELHDVGKLAVRAEVLGKAGPLDDGEWALIRRHPVLGERILAAVPELAAAAVIAGSHHERFDGSGYPRGLRGEEIPLAARIVAVCDAFNAMTSARPYKPALPFGDAMTEIERGCGTLFDPTVVDAFRGEMVTAVGAWAAAV